MDGLLYVGVVTAKILADVLPESLIFVKVRTIALTKSSAIARLN
jgi:hypothetical protein